MLTFSQLVDRAIQRTGRVDKRVDAADYTNQTLRELHVHPQTQQPVEYGKSFEEDAITITTASPFVWTPPELMQTLYAVKYVNGEYPKQLRPGQSQRGQSYYYYQTGYQYAFRNAGAIGDTISVAYTLYPRRFVYYTTGARVAEYDLTAGWTYADAINTAELQAEAQELVQHWLIRDWFDTVLEGVVAKIFKNADDEKRASMAFSLYSQGRLMLLQAESMSRQGGNLNVF
jgi:hypothetical protein